MRSQLSFRRTLFVILAFVSLPALFASCGGGGGGGIPFFPPAGGGTRYSISGVVTDGSNGMADVTITIGGTGSGTITTDANGSFTISNLQSGSYTLAPSKTNTRFTPASRTVTLPESVANADFTMTVLLQGDASEGAGGSTTDDTAATASPITVDINQVRTLYPDGDVDWVKINFSSGGDYEFSAYKLSNASDVVMSLYDCANQNNPVPVVVVPDDDYIGLDSRIRYTIPAAGDYCLQVKSDDWVNPLTGNGIATYTLSVHPFVDGDGDGVSTFYDCDDSNARNPLLADTPADGIDQDCTGNDALDGRAGTAVVDPVDAASLDDTPANARVMAASDGDGWEIQLRSEIFSSNARTIAPAGDVDVFSVEIPARSAINVHLATMQTNATIYIYQVDSAGNDVLLSNGGPDNYCNASIALNACQVDFSDPTDFYQIFNTGLIPKTVYLKFAHPAGGTDFYVPFYYSVGQDLDGDTYYTGDIPGWRDCNDADAAISPGGTDNSVDGTDQNCNGVDGS